jgi:hypothetical protein
VEADSTALVNLLCPVAFAGSWGSGVVEEPGVEPLKEFFCRLCDIVPELVLELIFMGSLSEVPNAPGMMIGAELGAGTPPAVYGIPIGIGVVLGPLSLLRKSSGRCAVELPTEPPRGRGVILEPKTDALGDGSGIASLKGASGGGLRGVKGTAPVAVVGVADADDDDAGVRGIGGKGLLVPKT